MPHILSELGALAGQNQPLAYFIIYIATIFFGNISAFVSFWLVFNGTFGMYGGLLLPAILFLSALSGDLIWYSIGKGLHETRLGYFMRNRFAPQHEKVEAAIGKNGHGWIFVSKFLYASSFPVIFTVGWVDYPFRKFFRTSAVSTVVWLPVLTGVAYGLFAGLSPLQAVASFERIEIIFLIGLGLFVLVEYFLAKIAKKIFRKIFKNGINSSESDDSRQNSASDN